MRAPGFLAIFFALLWLGPAHPASAAEGISVSDAWIRYLPAGLPAAGYFTLRNDTAGPITLEGAESGAFARIVMHRTIHEGASAAMQDVERLTVAPGKTVVFAPGGYHLMLLQGNGPMKPGDRVEILLDLANGRRLPVAFTVKSATGQ
jgi:periplasmic copper chaperone A